MDGWTLAWLIGAILISETIYILWARREGVFDVSDLFVMKIPSIMAGAIGSLLLVLFGYSIKISEVTLKDILLPLIVIVCLVILFVVNYFIGRLVTVGFRGMFPKEEKKKTK